MAKNQDGSRGVKSKSSKPVLPFRPIRDWPSGQFVETVVLHIKETGQPETMPSLFRNQIAKTEEFRIIRPIEIDGKKRPEGDHAPCPMCTSNRFLAGHLVYLPKLQACAVIGHCCADKVTAANAERDYKFRQRRDYEDDYLLECLPLVDARMAALESLKPAAIEAQRLYRKFRKNHPLVHAMLRSTKHQYSDRLMLSQIIRGGEDEDESDYVGPAGFGKRGRIETREHDFGLLSGSLVLIIDYTPVKDLDMIIRQLASVHCIPSQEATLEFVTSISAEQRRAGVAIMEGVDAGVEKFKGRIREFLQFFTRENAQVINAFGTSDYNSLYFKAEFELIHNRPCLTIMHKGKPCQLLVGDSFAGLDIKWPSAVQ
ncbi:MAG: hypothetical protein AB7F72_09860 [Afipia sp.]